jgi:hypothetical protein
MCFPPSLTTSPTAGVAMPGPDAGGVLTNLGITSKAPPDAGGVTTDGTPKAMLAGPGGAGVRMPEPNAGGVRTRQGILPGNGLTFQGSLRSIPGKGS